MRSNRLSYSPRTARGYPTGSAPPWGFGVALDEKDLDAVHNVADEVGDRGVALHRSRMWITSSAANTRP